MRTNIASKRCSGDMLTPTNIDAHAAVSARWNRQDLDKLIDLLRGDGYQVYGPHLQNKAIGYAEIASLDDLPMGWSDEQEPGHYRLQEQAQPTLFSYVVGPHAWKMFLKPPDEKLWSVNRGEQDITAEEPPVAPKKMAFLGVRSCDLHALAIQDKIYVQGAVVDERYAARRRSTLIIAVNCTQAASTCFCTSMNTGPKASAGFDLALTEVMQPAAHFFVVSAGSAQGHTLLEKVSKRAASAQDQLAALDAEQNAVAQVNANKGLNTANIKQRLYDNVEHPHWEAVADRCLSCANCTMSCPTCFCSTVEDVTDLSGDHSERWQRWDSCFTADFSYLHGGSARASTKSRYRQWLTHKLASWQDQFGTSGCVGCGRCVSWCPVGIDLRDEVEVFPVTEGTDENH